MVNDERGYPIKSSPLIHRQIAYSEIYLKNRDKYPKLFSDYLVHHINTDKEDFSVDNLFICTKEQHDKIHDEQKRVKRKFKNIKEINAFLNKPQKKLDFKRKDYDEEELIKGAREFRKSFEKEKKYNCLDCGRVINHRGKCFHCNTEERKERVKKYEKNFEKKQKDKKILNILIKMFLVSIFLFLIFLSINPFENDSSVTEDRYKKKLEVTKDWSSEYACNLCDSLLGKENVGGCGGIPNYDFFSCSHNSETEQIQIDPPIFASKNYYFDIFTNKELSKEEVENRRKIWKEFLDNRQ
ncbi:MAG: HNH endonuclease [Candidatus Woesearchaeota archaeon]